MDSPHSQSPGARLPDFGLEDAVALVTGAAGHLGTEISLALAAAGAHVFLNGRTRSKLETLADEISAAGRTATVCDFDVTDAAQVEAGLCAVRSSVGRLDVLVNNAYSGRTGSIESVEAEDFIESYEVAVAGAYRVAKSSLDMLRVGAQARQGGASIINIASMYGVVSPDPGVYGDSGFNNPPHYGAAKAALLQMTRYLACHMADIPVRVNAVSPGPFPQSADSPEVRALHERLARKVPLGRVGHPRELAGAVVFLASTASSYVTGANIPVDGGWTAW